MLSRPGLGMRVPPALVAELLIAAYLAVHPHTRSWRRVVGPLRRAARLLVCWSRDGRPFSQRALAQAAGLRRSGQIRRARGPGGSDGAAVAPRDRGRTTAMRFIHTLVDLQLVEVVDDAGKPIPRHTFLPPGTVPRYRVLVDHWTPELVDRLRADPAWAIRLDLAWAAHQLGAPDQLLGSWLRRRPARAGDAALQAWCRRVLAAQRRREEQEAAAVEEAIARRERGQDPTTGGTLAAIERRAAGHCTPPVDGLTTVSRPTGRDGASGDGGELGDDAPIARAREARALERIPDDAGWIDLDRQDVADRLAETVAKVRLLREEWVQLAAGLGEQRPAAGWRQVRNVARRCGTTLDDIVGRYERASDQVTGDIPVRVNAQQRQPVEAPHKFAMGIVRRSLGLSRGRTCHAGLAPSARPARPAGDPPILPVYMPEPEPERRLMASERRSIRERAEAQRQDGEAGAGGRADVHLLVVPGTGEALVLAERRREVRWHHFAASQLQVLERPPTPAQLEEARRALAEGLPVPERYRRWLRGGGGGLLSSPPEASTPDPDVGPIPSASPGQPRAVEHSGGKHIV